MTRPPANLWLAWWCSCFSFRRTRLDVKSTIPLSPSFRYHLLPPSRLSMRLLLVSSMFIFFPQGQVLPGHESGRCSLPHPGLRLQIQERAGMVSSWFKFFTRDANKVHIHLSRMLSTTIGRRRFDLQNPSRMDRNVEMFLNVEKNLVQVCPCDMAG